MKAKLEVNPYNYREADLYIPETSFKILVRELGTNKLTVTLRVLG